MRTVLLIAVFIFVRINVFAASGYYEDCYYETGDNIRVSVSGRASIDEDDHTFSYGYTLKSQPQSKQEIWVFQIILPEKDIVNNTGAPVGWRAPGWTKKHLKEPALIEKKPPYWIAWTAPEGKDIKPLETIAGFLFETSYGLPGIVDYYAEGGSVARCPEGMAVDFIPGYNDLTPYGPGIVGKTIGPTAPPDDFKPLDFLNSIINMKHEAFKLGWIKNEGTVKSLDAKLDNAKKDIEKGNTRSAKNTLKAFINEVEAQGCESYENCPTGKHLTSEAYGLLKYNAQYLIEHL